MFIRRNKMVFVAILLLFGFGSSLFLLKIYKSRPWIPNYVVHALTQQKNPDNFSAPTHLIFLYVDHFEPSWGNATFEKQKKRVNTWLERYPEMAMKHLDSDGRHPQYTWFYLASGWNNRAQDRTQNRSENYRHLREISKLCYDGFGEIELHVHHGSVQSGNVRDSQALEELFNNLKYFYSLVGASITAENNPIRTYGFIHGMHALDNSNEKYCGINDELTVLKTTECYADFTMPSGPKSPTTAKKINSIYYAKDDPHKPKSYDTGVAVSVGNASKDASKEGLMIFSGPFHIYFGISDITAETGALGMDSSLTKHPIEERIDDWVKANIHVKDQPNWIFVKVSTHGCMEMNFPFAFGQIAHQMFSYLEKRYNDGEKFQLHYVTAREAYNIVKAAEDGKSGNPDDYRNYRIKPYANSKISSNRPYQLETYSPHELVVQIKEDTGDVNLRFKDLLLKEIESFELQTLKYTLDRREKRISIYLSGKGETGIHLSIPKEDVSKEIFVSNGTLVKREERNEEIECYLTTSLKDLQMKKVDIQF